MKNVIISRNGSDSLHGHWLTNADDRNWHLILLHYDPRSYKETPNSNIESYYYPGGKWEAYYNFFTKNKEVLDNYDYFWFADDDITIQGDQISKMFNAMREYDLDIAQPALSKQSYYSYLATVQCESFKIRFTNIVEVMAPCLKKEVVKEMLPFFKGSFTGMGLDSVWSYKTRKEPNKMAILDNVVMTHTRPIGGPLHEKLQQKKLTVEGELNSNLNKIGIKQIKPVIFSGIDKQQITHEKTKVSRMMAKEYFYKRKDFKDNRKILSKIWRMIKYHQIYRIKPIF